MTNTNEQRREKAVYDDATAIKQLETVVDNFLRDAYGIERKIPIVINGRLSRSMGRYVYYSSGEPLQIEMARYVMDYGTVEQIIDIVKHEAVHYALHSQGIPHHDGHPTFESELRKHGISSTNTDSIPRPRLMQVYECECRVHLRRTKVAKGQWLECGGCDARFEHIGERTVWI